MNPSANIHVNTIYKDILSEWWWWFLATDTNISAVGQWHRALILQSHDTKCDSNMPSLCQLSSALLRHPKSWVMSAIPFLIHLSQVSFYMLCGLFAFYNYDILLTENISTTTAGKAGLLFCLNDSIVHWEIAKAGRAYCSISIRWTMPYLFYWANIILLYVACALSSIEMLKEQEDLLFSFIRWKMLPIFNGTERQFLSM